MIRHSKNFKTNFLKHTEEIEYWKSLEERIRKPIELRFTTDKDVTTGYIDFLDNRKEIESYDGPNLPATLLLSGDGTFSNPFYLNIKDPYIKQMNLLCHDRLWDKFVYNINSKLL